MDYPKTYGIYAAHNIYLDTKTSKTFSIHITMESSPFQMDSSEFYKAVAKTVV